LVLLKAGRQPEGAVQFARAIELEPYFAHLHYYLGRLFDAADMLDQAVVHYRAF